MYGTGVPERNACDIDQQVVKVLGGLGAPEPPIRLRTFGNCCAWISATIRQATRG